MMPKVVAKFGETCSRPSCTKLHTGFEGVATNPWKMQAFAGSKCKCFEKNEIC